MPTNDLGSHDYEATSEADALRDLAARFLLASQHLSSVLTSSTADGICISDLQASLHEFRAVLFEVEVVAGEGHVSDVEQGFHSISRGP